MVVIVPNFSELPYNYKRFGSFKAVKLDEKGQFRKRLALIFLNFHKKVLIL